MTNLEPVATALEQSASDYQASYLFGAGYGTVRRDFWGYSSTELPPPITIAPDISPEQITVTRVWNTLYLSVNGTSDQLILENWYRSIDKSGASSWPIVFADGGTWNVEEVDRLTVMQVATDGDDEIFGNSQDNWFDGGAGDDALSGFDGNDTYVFGAGYGRDVIEDDANRADSFDVVRMLEGVAPGDVTVTRTKYNIELALGDGSDTLVLYDWFYDPLYLVEEVRFSDPAGTVWDAAYFDRLFEGNFGTDDGLYGTRSNEVLLGGEGDDWAIEGMLGNDVIDAGAGFDYILERKGRDLLHGGTGNDMINASGGAKVVTFNAGDGIDSLSTDYYRMKSPLTISLGGGISAEQLSLSGFGDDFEPGTGNAWWGELLIGGDDRIELGFMSLQSRDDVLATLQIIGADIRIYDLAAVLADFRAAGSPAGWSMAASLDAHLLSVSTDAAIGGAIAYAYATEGNMSGLGEAAIQSTLAHADFALRPQSLSGDMSGDNVLEGTDGADVLDGEAGNDTLHGGAGSDTLIGGSGNDTYLFGAGDGEDAIRESDASAGNTDTVRLDAGIGAADVLLYRDAANLYLGIHGTEDLLTMTNWFTDPAHRVEQIAFENGTTWGSTVLARAETAIIGADSAKDFRGGGGNDIMIGEESADTMTGKGGDDTLNGGGGDDILEGGAGDDILNGGAGSDVLYGGNGADMLAGGAGSDTLNGGIGNDHYRFGHGSGRDLIIDADHRAGNLDVLTFGAGISADALWFRKSGKNLDIGIAGSDDMVTVQNWYAGTANRVEEFRTANGDVLRHDQVDVLVSAMSAVDVALVGQAGLPAALLGVVAAAWE